MGEEDDLPKQEHGAVPAPQPSEADRNAPPGPSAQEEVQVSSTETRGSSIWPGDAPSEEAATAPAVAEEISAEEVLKQEVLKQEVLNQEVQAESRQHTRRSFAVAAVAAAAGYSLYNWIVDRPQDEMQPRPMRRAFEINAAISRAIFEERALAPVYALNRAENLRVNGVYGLKRALDSGSWRLQVVGVSDAQRHARFSSDVTAWRYLYVDALSSEDQGHETKIPPPSARTAEKMAPESMLEQESQRENRAGRMPRGQEEAGQSRSTLPPGTSGLLLTMDDILRLPRHELVTQFKCIEGWSQIVHWAGVRMADFLEAYPPALVKGKEPQFVYMETPDGDYYTGYDMKVCRHPQTILVTEMMGSPLTQFHGAPLRLHMPTKYGYKQIKRIGLIDYTEDRPDDYWTKLGYDWYAEL